MNQQICRRNKFAYCKHSDKCRFRHNDEICVDKKCSIYNCEKRHPRICKFQREYGRCKFTTYCRYSHEKNSDIAQNSDKIQEIEKKIINIESKAVINNPVEKNLVKEVQKKMDTFENEIKTLRKALEDKDSFIHMLEKRLDTVEKKFTEEKCVREKEMNKKIKDLEGFIKKQTKKKAEHFSCKTCEFKTTSSQGLKTHVKRKHTKINEVKYPQTCNLCETELDNEKQMNLHLKTHSYRDGEKLKFKCEDCDFWGPNSLTMEVHTVV